MTTLRGSAALAAFSMLLAALAITSVAPAADAPRRARVFPESGTREVTIDKERNVLVIREYLTQNPGGESDEPRELKIPGVKKTFATFCNLRPQGVHCGELAEYVCPTAIVVMQGEKMSECDVDCNPPTPDPVTHECECDIDLSSCR